MSQQKVRTFYIASKMLGDALMTATAFVLGYQFRLWVPFPSAPVDVSGFLTYLPMMIVQVGSVTSINCITSSGPAPVWMKHTIFSARSASQP
jgi:ABC-type polysaccharide/polyol phosphate export permease